MKGIPDAEHKHKTHTHNETIIEKRVEIFPECFSLFSFLFLNFIMEIIILRINLTWCAVMTELFIHAVMLYVLWLPTIVAAVARVVL